MGIEWGGLRDTDRPSGELAMTAYLAAPDPQPTHISKLDQLLGGGMTRGLTVLGGPPSSGKSVVACLAAALMAAGGTRVVYASYEMSWEVVQLRCASAWSCHQPEDGGIVPFAWSHVVNGTYRDGHPEYRGLSRADLSRYLVGGAMDDVTRALTAWDEGPGRNLCVLTGGYDVADLIKVVTELDGEPPVMIVDYLQIMPSGNDGRQEEYQRVTDVVNALQSMAYGDGGPNNVLAISSTRNLTPSDYKEGPSLSWYRGSGYVGFAAEQAVMLTIDRRKDEASGQMVPSTAPDGWTEGRMTVVKNKSGASGVSIATKLAGWCNLFA